MTVFDEMESEVRSYCRSFPTVFTQASGAVLRDEEDNEYIDFFSGAGALNYGHNEPRLRERLVEYIAGDGIIHSLDMSTKAKKEFLTAFNEIILRPRGMRYKIMFPGPTGTNSVESALKLARKVTGRDLILSFTNAFHGMTLGSLAVSGNMFKREGAGVTLGNSVSMPFENFMGDEVDTIEYLERYLDDDGSGVATPAAIILETLQAEGGINVASVEWLKNLEGICRRRGVLLIVDDIQVGCGRTGPFFSFEGAGIEPDIVCLSKSLSGYGLPMAITLIRPDLDLWDPGEHNGTFRGHNPAFVTAAETLRLYWKDDALTREVESKGRIVHGFLESLVADYPELQAEVRGKGMMQGIACGDEDVARRICAAAFSAGLLMETAGPNGNVVKLMPPLTIGEATLKRGLSILERSVRAQRLKKEVPA